MRPQGKDPALLGPWAVLVLVLMLIMEGRARKSHQAKKGRIVYWSLCLDLGHGPPELDSLLCPCLAL